MTFYFGFLPFDFGPPFAKATEGKQGAKGREPPAQVWGLNKKTKKFLLKYILILLKCRF
jgi:hypothetical protein